MTLRPTRSGRHRTRPRGWPGGSRCAWRTARVHPSAAPAWQPAIAASDPRPRPPPDSWLLVRSRRRPARRASPVRRPSRTTTSTDGRAACWHTARSDRPVPRNLVTCTRRRSSSETRTRVGTARDSHPPPGRDVSAEICIGVPGNNRVPPREPSTAPRSSHFQFEIHALRTCREPPPSDRLTFASVDNCRWRVVSSTDVLQSLLRNGRGGGARAGDGFEDWVVANSYRPVDRGQAFLLPPDMADWLPQDHLVWFLIDAVEGMDTDGVPLAAGQGAGVGRGGRGSIRTCW